MDDAVFQSMLEELTVKNWICPWHAAQRQYDPECETCQKGPAFGRKVWAWLATVACPKPG